MDKYIKMKNKEELYKKAFGERNGCYHFPEMKEDVILCMTIAEEQFKQDLKNKIKKSINVLLEINIDDDSRNGAISALNLVLKECKHTYSVDYSK